MRAIPLLLALLVLPTALAMPPFIGVWDGDAEVSAFLAQGTTLCRDAGPATLHVEEEMEAATFVLQTTTACAPTLVFRGILTPQGWTFRDDAGVASGGFVRSAEPGVWALDALVDTCPSFAVCELAHGVRVHGTFHSPTIIL